MELRTDLNAKGNERRTVEPAEHRAAEGRVNYDSPSRTSVRSRSSAHCEELNIDTVYKGPRRTAVSAEVSDLCSRLSSSANTTAWSSKSAETRHWLRDALSHVTLFQSLDDAALDAIVDGCWKCPTISPAEVVISQGDEVAGKAPGLYVLEHGSLTAFKCAGSQKAPGMVVRTYKQRGDIFGELALLYNGPRAATVIAKSESVLWTVSRNTVMHVNREAAERMRTMFDALLRGVDILQPLTIVERAKLCDVLQVEKFRNGELIIRQGDIGDNFYLVMEGEAAAEKDGREVMKYLRGSYFGELALLTNQHRAASVKAVLNCTCATLDRDSFNRLLGPLENLRGRAREIYSNENVLERPISRSSRSDAYCHQRKEEGIQAFTESAYSVLYSKSHDYICWGFDSDGAFVRKVRRNPPVASVGQIFGVGDPRQLFNVGDRIVSINGFDVYQRPREDIQSLWGQQQNMTPFLQLSLQPVSSNC